MNLKNAKFHFVGIGGIGMCGLAELLHNMGARVSGSDLHENANTSHLQKLGIPVMFGHQAENLRDADVLVYSSAVPETNPEVVEARKNKIPLIPRAEALAEIMRSKRGLAVAGTHGKTTTTSMAAAIFLAAHLNPTIVVGGRFDLIKSTALLGTGEWLVAEADESDGSFHKLSPEIAIITNIDNDHLDHYKSFSNLQKSFFDFAQRLPFYGSCVACGDDTILRKTFQQFNKRIIFYGFNQENEYRLEGERGRYRLRHDDKFLGEFSLAVPGKHNALNATAAIVASLQAGISFENCAKGLSQYQGVDRRFQLKGSSHSIDVYDDYGHHPTEVLATLSAFKEKFPNRRIVVMFQPHRFSRTESCWKEFLTAFKDADLLCLTDVYPAGEKPIPGIDSARLSKEVQHASVAYLPKEAGLAKKITSMLKAHDVFVTLGAGDGWKVGMQVLEELNAKN